MLTLIRSLRLKDGFPLSGSVFLMNYRVIQGKTHFRNEHVNRDQISCVYSIKGKRKLKWHIMMKFSLHDEVWSFKEHLPFIFQNLYL